MIRRGGQIACALLSEELFEQVWPVSQRGVRMHEMSERKMALFEKAREDSIAQNSED